MESLCTFLTCYLVSVLLNTHTHNSHSTFYPSYTQGLTDYPLIIKQPMDLGTIKERLVNTKTKPRYYNTLFQVAEDVRLVWNNCKRYNADGSDFYKLAESLQKKWDEKYTKLLQDVTKNSSSTTKTTSTTTSESNKVSLSDKKAFARALYQISKEDLGKVLVEVEAKCPTALIKNNSEQEMEFNVDALPAAVLQELMQFVSSVKGKKKPAPKNSKATPKAAASSK